MNIKLLLEQFVDTDKNGTELKDREGNLLYRRNDHIALLQLLNATDSRAIAVNEYKALLTLEDKIRGVWRKDGNEVELNLDESALLKKLFNNPQNDKISFSLFHIRTIQGLLEQLR